MNKYKCIIVEDEQPNMRLLESYVSELEQLELIGTFVSPLQLLNSDALRDAQIIFLDIQMPAMTGIEFLKSIPVDAQVIITTAYTEYALQGYELNVTDYLLKPIEFLRFVQATQKAIDQLKLLDGVEESKPEAHIMLKVDKKLMKFQLRDIVYVMSDWNYIHVFTQKGKHVVLSSMKAMERQLNGNNFCRVHQSYLVNMDYFEFIEGNQISVGGSLIQVSRRYKEQLMKFISGA
ncbi:response regulator transcription factor [Prolixibacteraceae bacterium JC049]|nr:response regulator transcription factor [Prolixibacteraceae bacterium JC049]